MGMYDNLKRANSQQITQFILHETPLSDSTILQPYSLEERCSISENNLFNLAKDILRIENEYSMEYEKLLSVSSELQQAYFELGIKAGMTMAIGFELGDNIR